MRRSQCLECGEGPFPVTVLTVDQSRQVEPISFFREARQHSERAFERFASLAMPRHLVMQERKAGVGMGIIGSDLKRLFVCT